jgi:hypothetical protein
VVNFFVCGVQKGGTTALDRYLRSHPDIEMARTKEVHFFDDDSRAWDCPDYGTLHQAFADPTGPRRRGEATPIYTYWPRSLERLQTYNPVAKLIMLLRQPIRRAFSQWRMETHRGWDTLPFSAAIRPTGRLRVGSAPGGVHRVFSYVERGFYAPQVERMLQLFPRTQLLFLRTDALWRDPEQTLRRVHSFLEVAPAPPGEHRYTVSVKSDAHAPPELDDAEYLSAIYADDILATASLTGLDLRDWLEPASSLGEPMRP